MGWWDLGRGKKKCSDDGGGRGVGDWRCIAALWMGLVGLLCIIE